MSKLKRQNLYDRSRGFRLGISTLIWLLGSGLCHCGPPLSADYYLSLLGLPVSHQRAEVDARAECLTRSIAAVPNH